MNSDEAKLYNQLVSLGRVVYAYEQMAKETRHPIGDIILRYIGVAVMNLNIDICVLYLWRLYMEKTMSEDQLMRFINSPDANEKFVNVFKITAFISLIIVPIIVSIMIHNRSFHKSKKKFKETKEKYKGCYDDLLYMDPKYINSYALSYMANELATGRAHSLNELLDRYDNYLFKNNIANSVEQIRRNSYWWY